MTRREVLQHKLDLTQAKIDALPDWVFFPLPIGIISGLILLWMAINGELTWENLYRIGFILGIIVSSPIVLVAIAYWAIKTYIEGRSDYYDAEKGKVVPPRARIAKLERELRLSKANFAGLQAGNDAQHKMLISCMEQLKKMSS